jgi:hypothetical protein
MVLNTINLNLLQLIIIILEMSYFIFYDHKNEINFENVEN